VIGSLPRRLPSGQVQCVGHMSSDERGVGVIPTSRYERATVLNSKCISGI
jgi:hypothetical protein